jgi:hypothetical protein
MMQPDKTRCAACGARDHALGGRAAKGAFMLALPLATSAGNTAWPRVGTNGWCGDPAGEVERLSIVRISLGRTCQGSNTTFLCQFCRMDHESLQGNLFGQLERSA